MASSAHDGSNLFKIRRIFGFPSSSANGDASPAELPALQIASMAVHTLEKKQLLALAISEESTPSSIPGDSAVSSAPGTAALAPVAAKTNFLLLRTIEEDQRARFWRFPVCSTPKQQQAGKAERLTALEFSPEGDWLAALSSRKNRLHLLPVLTLIARQRRALLDATYQPTSHLRELMSVHQAAMTTQMASYLRATNEYGGLNGARYHSQVAGDDEQMSTLEFAPGIGRVTCVRWWRSLNGKNYCLVGGTESLVSIVNVEENAEECRCELANAGAIVSIDLLHENFRKERRTSMLVKAKSEDIDEKEKEAGGSGLRYYRVVLEKKFQPKPKASPRKTESRQDKKPTTPVSSSGSGLTIVTTTGGSSSSGDTTFTTSGAAGSGSMSPFPVSKPPQFVVKTFPQHFLEDLDFRPQRIKKNSPHVCMYAINGMLSSESSLALYDCKKRKANLYSNFHWRLKSEYQVPDLLPSASAGSNQEQQEAEDVLDVDLTYCSTDLMLLQGRSAASNETISTWVSLPSHQGMDEDVVTAHIVHYLTLHGNERIERVVQSTARSQAVSGASGGGSQSDEAEIIYILQTKHHVYECRPQWSRLALFKALCGRSIALRDALSIGYALGIDMASLCQVVANTLYTSVIDGSATADPPFVQWVRELFEVSRVMPSSAVEQLTAIGGVQNAIDYAQHVLSKPVRDSFDDIGERRRVALLLVDLVLQQQLQKDPSLAFDGGQMSTLHGPQQTDDEREAWLVVFLETNQDYLTTDIVDLCLSQQHVDKALLVATRRQEVPQVLEKIVQVGLASSVSEKAMRSLLASGHASALTAPSSRLILRSFPVEVQAEILLAHPPAILQHRDWLERNLSAISLPLCQQLAVSIDPTQPDDADLTASATAKDCPTAKPSVHSDIATSEFITVAPEEQLELFLTLLLRLNSQGEGECSQARLETLLKDLAAQYRPPIMVPRCLDYENWTAAACIYEAHGELVEALECRLHSHKTRSLSVSSPMAAPASDGPVTRHRQYSDDSVSSVRSDESEFHEQMREELLSLLNSLVVQSHSTKAISEQVRAAILARLLVKWFDYGLKRTVLEVFLIDPNVFVHVSSLLAQIFFSEVVDSILGVESFAGGPVTSSNGSGGGFDDRDQEWVRQCHRLPFSGQFLFHVCSSFLEKDKAKAAEASTTSRSSQSSTLKLLELVKSNAVQNDLSHPAVAISPHSAQALGKTDPLETHVKAFTCGHLFPKRMFEEELLPEFDKRMNALPLPLFATKQAFAHEFKRSASETPCPICSFNKISERVYEQRQASSKRSEPEESATTKKARRKTEQSTRRPQPGATPYYFLHREAHERLAFSSPLSTADLKNRKPLQHEAWEWREQHAS
ncbi:hypothetical protein BBJ28_00005918 [Nothophytophthora sp. Chile5]|nr:hypothetical protein BBJ28_00005918 [Nothophytophthora sp. Chile5]